MVNEDRKSERIPVMFEKGLLAEVDDFSFARRIRSRGATVRELVRIGLAAAENKKGDASA